MSYFISGLGVEADVRSTFEEAISEFVPMDKRENAITHESGTSFFCSYGRDKIIPDIEITTEHGGSWLAIIGTPLTDFKKDEKKKDLLSAFLATPAATVRSTIDGNFAAIAYDAQKRQLIIASDYNNTIPLFYSAYAGGCLISSHELALARCVKKDIDPLGFFQSINLGVPWDSRTRFKSISKTIPCQVISCKSAEWVCIEQYWRPTDEQMWSFSFDELIEHWISLLAKSIKMFYESSGKASATADFTGGEDSRLIVAQCHALNLPFRVQVAGAVNDIDVKIASGAANKLGIDMIIREKHWPTKEMLLTRAIDICLSGDAYREFTVACVDYATNIYSPLDDYLEVKYCGVPGGEAFRGSYYLRGKAAFPSKKKDLDYEFFMRMKYLLDYYPGLLKQSDQEGIETIHEIVRRDLKDVKEFPVGTKIDHMLRLYQTSFLGLKYKNPLYLPLAVSNMTRSIYNIPPRFKKGGKLTRACTEVLFPELAHIRTEKGIPTVRKTPFRAPLFIPEYGAMVKGIYSGAISRLFKISKANKWYYNQDRNAYIFFSMLNSSPYDGWFSSAAKMRTGFLYNPTVLNPILDRAKNGDFRFLPILGRIVNQELACRWVYSDI